MLYVVYMLLVAFITIQTHTHSHTVGDENFYKTSSKHKRNYDI